MTALTLLQQKEMAQQLALLLKQCRHDAALSEPEACLLYGVSLKALDKIEKGDLAIWQSKSLNRMSKLFATYNKALQFSLVDYNPEEELQRAAGTDELKKMLQELIKKM